jgi:hypothetical protein
MTDWTQLEKDLEASTDGPWQPFYDNGVGVTALGGDQADVAHCHEFHSLRQDDEVKANARLISRAPDLAALALAGKRLADAADEWSDHDGEIGYEAVARKVIAALTAFRKAEEKADG